jgi:hypothetical protein
VSEKAHHQQLKRARTFKTLRHHHILTGMGWHFVRGATSLAAAGCATTVADMALNKLPSLQASEKIPKRGDRELHQLLDISQSPTLR